MNGNWNLAGWSVEKLASLVNVVYGKSPAEIKKLDDGIPIFGTGGVIGYTSEALCNGPSVILGRKGTIDKVQRSAGPFWAIDTTYYTTPKRDFDWSWLYYVISSFDLRKLNEASGVPSLSRSSLESLDVATPPLPEQQKIAAILTAVDDKLDVIARQIEATQTLKRGLMQTLFSRGVGTQDAHGRWVPHTEFKDSEVGKVPAKWKVSTVGDVGDLKNGINKSKEAFGHGSPFVNLIDVFGKPSIGNSMFGLVETTEKERHEFHLKKGDILFVRSSVKPSGVGLTSLVREDIRDAVYSGFLIRFRPHDKNISSGILKHYFRSDAFRSVLLKKSTISANTNINQASLMSLPIIIPSMNEQSCITAVLDELEEKLELLMTKQQHFQVLKRGLMQKLLTGQWRVQPDHAGTPPPVAEAA